MKGLLSALGGARSLALIGMGKNVGKTTALNALVEEARSTGLTLALTSIGRDGELVDAISSHPKPPIRVAPGTWLGTVEGALPSVEGAFRVEEVTEMRTALGPIVLAQALREAQWELSGPALGSDLLWLRQRFFELGAQLVVFDGAFDRRSSATPSLTEATLIVSGAALDPDMQVVLEATRHRVELFRLPAHPDLSQPARQLLDARGMGWWSRQGAVVPVELPTALGAAERLAATRPGPEARLLLGRALTPALLQALEGLEIIVQDATMALIEAADLKRFRARGGRLWVHRPIALPFVVANPYSPYGWAFPPRDFLHLLAEYLHPVPVVDVVQGVALGLELAA